MKYVPKNLNLSCAFTDQVKNQRRSEPSAVHANPITGGEISEKESFLLTSNPSKSICAAPNSIADKESSSAQHFGGRSSFNGSVASELPKFLESNPASSSRLTATKKSKSQQEGQIVKQATSHLQRLVMSAKETCASAYRLLQTPLPELEVEEVEPNKNDSSNLEVILAEKSKSQSPQSNPDPDSFLEDRVVAEENPDDGSELYSVPDEHYSETCFEEEEIPDEASDSPSQQQQSWDSEQKNQHHIQDENRFESIFRSSTIDNDNISSHSLLQSDPRAPRNVAANKRTSRYDSKQNFRQSQVENRPSPKEQTSSHRTPPSDKATTSGDVNQAT